MIGKHNIIIIIIFTKQFPHTVNVHKNVQTGRILCDAIHRKCIVPFFVFIIQYKLISFCKSKLLCCRTGQDHTALSFLYISIKERVILRNSQYCNIQIVTKAFPF